MATRALAAEGRFELVHQIALFGGEIDRGFHHHLAVEVARRAAAHRLDALVAQAEDLAGLGLGGNADLGLASQRGYTHRIAERSLGDADRHLAMQVVAIALEDAVRAYPHFHVQVSGR